MLFVSTTEIFFQKTLSKVGYFQYFNIGNKEMQKIVHEISYGRANRLKREMSSFILCLVLTQNIHGQVARLELWTD